MRKLRNIFNSQSKTITAAAVILAFSSLASRVLGLFRIHLFAYFFGASDIYDMYVAAFRIPDLLFVILATGALSAGFIPVFTDFLNKNKKQAWQLANNVLNILLLALISISVILFLLAPWIVPLTVPGFDTEKTNTTINLTRLLLLQPILLGLSSLFSGILHSLKRFLVVAVAPLLYNIGIIIGIIFFYSWFGIYGLIFGVVLGAFMHMIIQVPGIIYSGFRYQPIFNFKDKKLKRILRLMPSRALALLTAQINVFVITMIASTLGAGKLSVFNYADLLQSFPLAIFGLSFAAAAFPTMAEFLSKKQKDKFINSLINTLRQILFFLVPASALIIVLRAQIVRVILGRGAFDWTATSLTINCLQFFAIGMFAHGTIFLFNRAFYALENTKTPFIIGFAGVVVNITGCLILSSIMGISGLALAFAIANIFTALVLFIVLHFKLGYLNDWVLFKSIFQISLAALLAGLVAYAGLYLMAPQVNMRTFAGIALQGFIAGIAGIAVYILVCWFLQLKEMLVLRDMIKLKLKKIYEIRFS